MHFVKYLWQRTQNRATSDQKSATDLPATKLFAEHNIRQQHGDRDESLVEQGLKLPRRSRSSDRGHDRATAFLPLISDDVDNFPSPCLICGVMELVKSIRGYTTAPPSTMYKKLFPWFAKNA
eukprot:GEMP01050979.1.p3 GENE.GEMP01050979.1~~GEMP01050979.1.p3  ORF type:complete len:122 (-),score=17.86 GEMP01050979.1:316-681(-)